MNLLESALHHVPDLGWSHETLNAAARDLHISEADVPVLVPGGPVSLVHHFVRKSNRSLSSHPLVVQEEEEEQSVSERLALVSRARLEMVVPYLDHGHWLNAMALSALPENAEETSRLALETVDEIWYVAGDRSVDYKWYTRRAGFVPVYCATELFLLTDDSTSKEETWNFLKRNVDMVFGDVNFVSAAGAAGAAGAAAGSQSGGGGHWQGGGRVEQDSVASGGGSSSVNATMMDTMGVATRGAVSLVSSLASIGSEILKESGGSVMEKMNVEGGRRKERRGGREEREEVKQE